MATSKLVQTYMIAKYSSPQIKNNWFIQRNYQVLLSPIFFMIHDKANENAFQHFTLYNYIVLEPVIISLTAYSFCSLLRRQNNLFLCDLIQGPIISLLKSAESWYVLHFSFIADEITKCSSC
jgi:hypothetical protein